MSRSNRVSAALFVVLYLLVSQALWAQTRAIEVDFSKVTGTIRPLNGVNGGPIVTRGAFDLSSRFTELGIKHVRLHDVPWFYENAVDINYIFPRFDLDANDPRNYDFSLTDYYLASVRATGADMLFRLGYSAEWRFHPPLHNTPPADVAKWALVCTNIIRHYNQGWANGYHYGIKYWEIWNEPDNPGFWTGSPEEFARFYETVARAVKATDPDAKVGGPGLATHLEFLETLVHYCAEHKVPLDFVSWHIYARVPYGIVSTAEKVQQILDRNGFSKTESVLDEWNYFPGDWTLQETDAAYRQNLFEKQTGGLPGAVFTASALVYLQDSSVAMADFYQGTTLFWGGLFDAFGVPRKTFYTFKAFHTLLNTPDRVAATGSDQDGLAVIAGMSKDRSGGTLFISNFGKQYKHFNIVLRGLPWSTSTVLEEYIINDDHDFSLVKTETHKTGDLEIGEDIGTPSVYLIRFRTDH